MNNTITIVGGGISGLTALHELKKHPQFQDASITLFEKEKHLGGTIQTQRSDHCLFELGPNGFLPRQETLDLVEELGCRSQLVSSRTAAKKRFVVTEGEMHQFPTDPLSLMAFTPMNPLDKMRLFGDLFIGSQNYPLESLEHFIKRRFGAKAANILVDAMVSGIFAGDVKALNAKESFPQLVDLEKKHGSVIKGLIAQRKQKKNLPKGIQTFLPGMQAIIQALEGRYGASIEKGVAVNRIVRNKKGGYIQETSQGKRETDHVIIAAPAYVTATMVEHLAPQLAEALRQIVYAPVVVFGFVFEEGALGQTMDGFGYLNTSAEDNPVLGVLWENNVFESRTSSGKILLRVMMGGVNHSNVANQPIEELRRIALEEIDLRFTLVDQPIEEHHKVWAKAIPQYDQNYVHWKNIIEQECASLPGLLLRANYLGGISMNDCIANAKKVVNLV